MKNLIKFFLILLALIFWSFVFCLNTYDPYEYDVYSKDADNVVDKDNLWSDSLRQWTKDIAWWIKDIAKPNVNNSTQAKVYTLYFVKKIVDYFLMLLAFFALIYLLYNLYFILTAAWDDNKFKKWFDWIKLTGFVIIWIWLSWLIISFVFYLVQIMTKTWS